MEPKFIDVQKKFLELIDSTLTGLMNSSPSQPAYIDFAKSLEIFTNSLKTFLETEKDFSQLNYRGS